MNPLKYLLNKTVGLKTRGLYAVTAGSMQGQFFVFINADGDWYDVLSMPDNIPMKINKSHIDEGLAKGVLDLVEILPKDVYEIACAEYKLRVKKLEESINEPTNRRKQSSSSRTLD